MQQVAVLDRLPRVQEGGAAVGVDGGAGEQDRTPRMAGEDDTGVLQDIALLVRMPGVAFEARVPGSGSGFDARSGQARRPERVKTPRQATSAETSRAKLRAFLLVQQAELNPWTAGCAPHRRNFPMTIDAKPSLLRP